MSEKNSLKNILLLDLERKFKAMKKNFPKNRFKLILTFITFLIGSKGFRSIFFYRIIRIKLSNYPLIRSFFLLLRWITFCVEIPYTAEIGNGFLIGHHDGIIINGSCIIGKNFTIQQGVTLGGNMNKQKEGRTAPLIGDNVFIGPGAKILGPIKIGDNCIIGANSVVLKDIPHDSVAFGIPAQIKKKVEKNYIEIENDYILSNSNKKNR